MSAPLFYAADAKQKLCPLISTVGKDGQLRRANCVAGECSLWEWEVSPSDTSIFPNVPAKRLEGCGRCSLPRDRYVNAQHVKVRAA